MGNELTIGTDRAVTTPEGVSALRRIVSSVAWTEDDAIECSRWLNGTLAGMIPLALVEARCALSPATIGDFKRFVSPTLTLVAPAGMSTEDAVAWQASAAEALRGIPADLLERGCSKARTICDHPAKILPAIFAEIGGAWAERKRQLARLGELETIARDRPAPAAGDPYVRPEEAAAIIEELGLRNTESAPVARHLGEPRNPTPTELGEIAKAVGIDPTARSVAPVADIAGLTIDEIFKQRHARRAGQSFERAA